jgi:flagellar biosynthesis anti-sigma factor FlgM
MKVDLTGLTESTLDSVKSSQRTPSEVAPGSSTESTAGEDAATLSVDSARVSSLVAKALDTPDTRTDRIETLRQAVQSGQYAVDPAQIAEAMLRRAE